MARQPKKPREIRHCPHHSTPLRKRRGAWSHKWIWYCTKPECNYTAQAPS